MTKNIAFADFEREIATSRRVLERIPDEHFSWKPHEKSMSLGDLSHHVANLLFWQIGILTNDHFDFAAVPERTWEIPTNREEVLQLFDRNAEQVRQLMNGADEAALEEP